MLWIEGQMQEMRGAGSATQSVLCQEPTWLGVQSQNAWGIPLLLGSPPSKRAGKGAAAAAASAWSGSAASTGAAGVVRGGRQDLDRRPRRPGRRERERERERATGGRGTASLRTGTFRAEIVRRLRFSGVPFAFRDRTDCALSARPRHTKNEAEISHRLIAVGERALGHSRRRGLFLIYTIVGGFEALNLKC